MDQIRFPPQYRSPPLNTPIRPDFSNLRKTLEMQKQTNRININDNYIRDEGCKILANFLQSNPQIVSIDMKGNNITGRGLSDICEVLKLNKILKSLNLEWNSVGIDSIGLESLASYLTQNNSLNHLDLRNNRISQNDSTILAAIIRNNKSIISLDLRWNELGNVGANCIKTALKDNKTIQSLELSGNNVSEEITKDIQAFLENNRKNTPIINNEILFEKENILDVSNNGQKVEDLTMNHYKKELSENTNYIIKLEKTLEGEKQEHMKSKSRFEQEFNKWKTKEFEYNKIIHDLEIKNASLLEEKNNISIRFQDLTEENDNLQRKTNEMLKLQEERIEQQGSDMEELEKRHRLTIDKILNDNALRTKELNKDWEDRLNTLEYRIKDFEIEKEEREKELKRIVENSAKQKISHEEQIREIQYKLGEQENIKFNTHLKFLENRMKTIEENRETLNKKNNDLLNEIKESENKRNNEILNFEKELLHLKEQNEFILTKNKEYELINEKFKNDLRHKDNIIEKLENEINNLNELIDKKKFENKKYIEKFIIEFNDDKANWESEKENQNRKIFEMQENLRSCDMENMRLRHDYQRLAEILQSSLNRSILETFTNNNFI